MIPSLIMILILIPSPASDPGQADAGPALALAASVLARRCPGGLRPGRKAGCDLREPRRL